MIKNGEKIEFKKEKRTAVIEEVTSYIVKMYVGGELAEERPLYGHSKRYAEDCAENWENGIIKK
tara:strand:- start:701 stop:892 length:192 start_codon:yes stop_codon:yes gene_type:complete